MWKSPGTQARMGRALRWFFGDGHVFPADDPAALLRGTDWVLDDVTGDGACY
jgi:hypothetical protein